MSRKKETITLSIPPGTKEQLEKLARRFNIFWGKSPSPSGLITAIAQQQLEIGEPFTLNPTQVKALQQSIKLLKDSGCIGDAQTLSSLLLERGQLEAPLRQAILQQVSQLSQAWRILIEQHIQNQQPFHLLYNNSQGEQWEYTVRYGEITFEEKRFYVQIWCEETEDIVNPKFPELIHNRCLRIDRIQAVIPTDVPWRQEGVDTTKVYLHFYRGMVKAYEPKANDVSNEVVGDVRQVVRKVSNPFWLIREVFRYGEDCEIVSPDSVRDYFREKINLLCQRYGVSIQDESNIV
ncbi:MAG: helix-turn-helix transcriptional regulator [Cyanophyceae cyanobacterium]